MQNALQGEPHILTAHQNRRLTTVFLMDFFLTKEQRDIKRAAAKFAQGEFQPELA
jgi:hypothetical protein